MVAGMYVAKTYSGIEDKHVSHHVSGFMLVLLKGNKIQDLKLKYQHKLVQNLKKPKGEKHFAQDSFPAEAKLVVDACFQSAVG